MLKARTLKWRSRALYFILSAILVIYELVRLPKKQSSNELIGEITIVFFLYIAFLCVIAGLFSMLKIPVDKKTISVINIICVIAFELYTKKRSKQQIYIDITDIVAYLLLAVFCLFICINRFTPNLNLVFETSDPAVHMKLIMDFIQNKAVSALYIQQVEFGLIISSLKHLFWKADIYKGFELIYSMNFVFTSWVFYRALRCFCKTNKEKLLAFIMTVVYTIGYPYNDFLFGFCYLQMTINIICVLFIITYEYLYSEIEGNYYKLALMCLCTAVGVGYTLFVPITFLAVLCCVTQKYLDNNKRIISIKYVLDNIIIFLLPTIIILWTVFFSTESDMMGGLIFEGYIYRNLFSDFSLYVFPLLFLYMSRREKNMFSYLFVLSLLYVGVLFLKMVTNQISTYYYYKLNYLLWLEILVLATLSFTFICKEAPKIAISYFIVCIVSYGLFTTNIIQKLSDKNILFSPYVDTSSTYRIYEFNKTIAERNTTIPKELIEICDLVNNQGESIAYVGDITYKYWFEALTNQRFINLDVNVDAIKTGGYCKYVVIEKNIEGVDYEDSIFANNVIFENDFGYIVGMNEYLGNGIDILKTNWY